MALTASVILFKKRQLNKSQGYFLCGEGERGKWLHLGSIDIEAQRLGYFLWKRKLSF